MQQILKKVIRTTSMTMCLSVAVAIVPTVTQAQSLDHPDLGGPGDPPHPPLVKSCGDVWKLTCISNATCGSYSVYASASVTEDGCMVKWREHTALGCTQNNRHAFSLGVDGRLTEWFFSRRETI